MTGESEVGDYRAELEELLSQNRARLRRLIQLRIDSRLSGRVDESDVIQEAFVEASERYEKFSEDSDCSPYIWLRFLTLQKLAQFHRRHIKVKSRTVKREVPGQRQVDSPATSAILAGEFVDEISTPLDKALRQEQKQKVTAAIESLSENDREILALRHYEQLSNSETAEALGIEAGTAYKRYIRALQQMKLKLEPLGSSSSNQVR